MRGSMRSGGLPLGYPSNTGELWLNAVDEVIRVFGAENEKVEKQRSEDQDVRKYCYWCSRGLECDEVGNSGRAKSGKGWPFIVPQPHTPHQATENMRYVHTYITNERPQNSCFFPQ